MKNLFLTSLFALSMGWFSFAQAEIIPELRDFISGEIETISQAINDSSGNGGEASSDEVANGDQDQEMMFFRRFLIRIRAMVGFDQQFGKIQVLPEVELVWQRDFKEGWSGYKP